MDPKDFNTENLKKYLTDKIKYNYNDETITAMLEQNVISRLHMFTSYRNIAFVAEENYVETEWKDMIALHYINTSYLCDSDVIRIHLLSRKQNISGETYLGFFTVRKINELNIALSFIYPNFSVLRKWNLKKSNKDKYYLMGYLKKVQVEGIEISMCTFPMFVQDGIVASCTHASMISMIKYLHHKHRFPNITLKNINNEYTFERTKTFPTKGLCYEQTIEVLSGKGIFVISETIKTTFDEEKNSMVHDEIQAAAVKRYIDSNIESGLPVMVMGDFAIMKDGNGYLLQHSILIIGHTINKKHEKDYIVYDDSGALLEKISGHANIIGTISWKQFMDICIYANILFPQYERVYLNCNDIMNRLIKLIRPVGEEQMSGDNIHDILNMRYILMDNVTVKKVLHDILFKNELIYKESKIEINEILKRNMPHYVWYCELEVAPGAYFVYIADPTYNSDTLMNIFINAQGLLLNKQLCALIPQGEKIYNVEGCLCDAAFGIKDKEYGNRK